MVACIRAFRIRLLREEPHTQKIAEAAVGLRTDNGGHEESSAIELPETNQR
jgi:bud site selection protein 20